MFLLLWIDWLIDWLIDCFSVTASSIDKINLWGQTTDNAGDLPLFLEKCSGFFIVAYVGLAEIKGLSVLTSPPKGAVIRTEPSFIETPSTMISPTILSSVQQRLVEPKNSYTQNQR